MIQSECNLLCIAKFLWLYEVTFFVLVTKGKNFAFFIGDGQEKTLIGIATFLKVDVFERKILPSSVQYCFIIVLKNC